MKKTTGQMLDEFKANGGEIRNLTTRKKKKNNSISFFKNRQIEAIKTRRSRNTRKVFHLIKSVNDE